MCEHFFPNSSFSHTHIGRSERFRSSFTIFSHYKIQSLILFIKCFRNNRINYKEWETRFMSITLKCLEKLFSIQIILHDLYFELCHERHNNRLIIGFIETETAFFWNIIIQFKRCTCSQSFLHVHLPIKKADVWDIAIDVLFAFVKFNVSFYKLLARDWSFYLY